MKQRAPMAIMEWKICQSFPDYEVSEYGHVRRCRPGRTRFVTGKLLSPGGGKSYPHFTLRRDGVGWMVSAHVLVAEAFIGPKPFDGAEVCHNDGTRTNCHYGNLRWGTRAENWADRIIHGTTFNGPQNPRAKLSLEDVAKIKALFSSGSRKADLARRFGVTITTIAGILNGRIWKCAA